MSVSYVLRNKNTLVYKTLKGDTEDLQNAYIYRDLKTARNRVNKLSGEWDILKVKIVLVLV